MKNFSKPRLFSRKTLTAFAPILVIAVTGIVVYTINETNTDTRRDAGSLNPQEKVLTLAEIDAAELKGDALKAVVDRENKYVERVEAQSRLAEVVEATGTVDKESPEVKAYEKAFEFDFSKVSDEDISKISESLRTSDSDDSLMMNLEEMEESNEVKELEGEQKSSSRSLVSKVNAQSGGGSSLPSVGVKRLPTIEGFNVEKFTGVANVQYPIDIPAIRGSIPYSLALDYSSRKIDELRLNKWKRTDWSNPAQDDNWDQRAWSDSQWSQTVGLGWDFSNLQKISVDPDNKNEYLFAWGGSQYRIKYVQAEDRYYTIPESNLKISRLSNARWRVVDNSGTTYVFGSDQTFPGGANPPMPTTNTFNEYTYGVASGSDWTPYCWLEYSGWNLSQITDIHGNSLTFEVEAKYGQTYIGNAPWGCTGYWTNNIQIKKVKYNYNESRQAFMSTVDFIYSDYKFKNNSDSDKIKRLDKIETRNDGKLLSVYELNYKDTFKNPLWNGLQNYLLLTSIKRKGIGGQGEELPYTFCYNSVTSTTPDSKICTGTDVSDARAAIVLNTEQKQRDYKPNNMYLVDADNGYGGKVSYYYEFVEKIPKICVNHKHKDNDTRARFCTNEVTNVREFTGDEIYEGVNPQSHNTSFYRISKIVANNDSTNVLNAHSKLKVTKYTYGGTPEAYAKDFKKDEFYGVKYLKFEGLQFYGYDTVRTFVYEPNSATDLDGVRTFLTHTEEKTLRSVSRGVTTNTHGDPNSQATTCYMADPRKGQIYESKVLNQAGNQVVGYTNTALAIGIRQAQNFEWITSEGHLVQKCYPNSEYWPNFDVLTRETYSNIDGKESKSQTFYDYDFDLNINNSFGNPVKQKDFGAINDASDDIYSYTKYMNPVTNTTNWADYKAKNLTSLPIISFTSGINANTYAAIDAIDPKQRYGISHSVYDERLGQWGYQAGVSGVKGLPSKVKTVYYGSSFENQTNRVEMSAYTDYNKYGNTTRSYAPWTEGTTKGVQSVTYYDNRYFMYPVCQLQARRKAVNLDPNADWKTVCSSNADRLATKYEYAQNPADEASWDDGLAKGLMYFTTDPNGAKSRFEYDHYGRVTKTYEPDPNIVGQVRSVASQEATYYDNLVPMRSRVASRSVIINNSGNSQEVRKTVDSIIDGFGNELESTMYSNWYDKEVNGVFTKVPYALYSRVDFNGVGQVTSKMDNVKLENKQMPTVPEKLSGGTVLTPEVRAEATITETKYDTLNRPYEVTVTTGQGTADALVTKEKIVYAGYITRSEDSRGTTSEVEVDPRGNTKRTTTYICNSTNAYCNSTTPGVTAITTSYQYHNLLQKPTAVIDANGIQVSNNVYNTAGMVLRVGDRDRGPMFNTYNNASQLVKVVNSKGDYIESVYDDMNRVTKTTMKNRANQVRREEEFVYDTNKLGKLYQRKLKDHTVSATKYLQVMTTEYDLVGKVTKSTNKALDLTNPAVLAGTQEKYVEISKNPQYTVTGVVRETNTKVKNSYFNSGTEYTVDNTVYRYDEDGKLLVSKDKLNGNADLVKEVRYSINGQPQLIKLGNNAVERYSYDRMQRLTNKTIVDSANAKLFDTNYGYEKKNGLATGLINKIYSNVSNLERNQFKYDSLGRLEGTVAGADNTEYNAIYTFDVVGNLMSKREDALVPCQICDMNRNGKVEHSSPTRQDLDFVTNCLGKPVSDPQCARANMDGSTGLINSGDVITFVSQCTARYANNSTCEVKETDMTNATRSYTDNYFLTSHILQNASNPEPNKCKIGEYTTKYGYNETINGCPYHGAMYSSYSNGTKSYYLYSHTGSIVMEKDANGTLVKEYKYDVLDMPAEYWELVNGSMKLVAKYYYGLDGQRIAKLTYDNDSTAPPASVVANPTFSPAGGTYTSAQTVTIATTTAGATIRYTTNGTVPTTTTGTVYSGAISISATTTLKAIAYKSGMTVSSVSSATYTINAGGGTTSYCPTGKYNLNATFDRRDGVLDQRVKLTGTTSFIVNYREIITDLVPTSTANIAKCWGRIVDTSNNTVACNSSKLYCTWTNGTASLRGQDPVTSGGCQLVVGKTYRTEIFLQNSANPAQTLQSCPSNNFSVTN